MMMTEQQRSFLRSIKKHSSQDSFMREWEPIDFLGSGTFGGVYLLQCGEEQCAVKIMRINRQMAARYTAELKALNTIRGEQHAVNIYEYETISIDRGGYADYYLVIRMEKLNKLPKSMSESEVISMGIQLSFFLEKCHSSSPKLYHRDIKPDNILVSDDGVYKLSDFGEAKMTNRTQNSTGYRGTPLYMSPEMHNYEGYDGRSDLYSLGVTMYVLLNGGVAPFAKNGDLTQAIRRRYSGETLPAIPGVSAEMMEILRRLCAVSREDRYASAQELGQALYSLEQKRRKKSAGAQYNSEIEYNDEDGDTDYYDEDDDYYEDDHDGDDEAVTIRGAAGNRRYPYIDRDERKTTAPRAVNRGGSRSRAGSMIFGLSRKTVIYLCAAAAVIITGVYLFHSEPGSGPITTDMVGLSFTSASGGYIVADCPSFKKDVSIPETHDGKPVVGIGDGAFEDCGDLVSVTIPDSITSIGSGAFSGCRSLSSVRIPSGVTSIGSGTFSGCRNLSSVTIPDSVTNIGNNAFSGCGSLSSLTIPHSVVSIGDGAFSGCISLTSVTIPDSVTQLGSRVFCGCEGLTSVTLPYGITSIPDYAFSKCVNLASVTIPGSVRRIGDSAFWGCSKLKSASVPESVTSIEAYAFYGCKKLTVYCREGSKMWAYCEENKIKHSPAE